MGGGGVLPKAPMASLRRTRNQTLDAARRHRLPRRRPPPERTKGAIRSGRAWYRLVGPAPALDEATLEKTFLEVTSQAGIPFDGEVTSARLGTIPAGAVARLELAYPNHSVPGPPLRRGGSNRPAQTHGRASPLTPRYARQRTPQAVGDR